MLFRSFHTADAAADRALEIVADGLYQVAVSDDALDAVLIRFTNRLFCLVHNGSSNRDVSRVAAAIASFSDGVVNVWDNNDNFVVDCFIVSSTDEETRSCARNMTL